jgi:hypothetical protein
MPFGLANAPATFQDAMETIFRVILHRRLLIYTDDFLIDSETDAELTQIVLALVRQLKEKNRPFAPDTCVSHASMFEFLGYILFAEEI